MKIQRNKLSWFCWNSMDRCLTPTQSASVIFQEIAIHQKTCAQYLDTIQVISQQMKNATSFKIHVFSSYRINVFKKNNVNPYIKSWKSKTRISHWRIINFTTLVETSSLIVTMYSVSLLKLFLPTPFLSETLT